MSVKSRKGWGLAMMDEDEQRWEEKLKRMAKPKPSDESQAWSEPRRLFSARHSWRGHRLCGLKKHSGLEKAGTRWG
jgi:hypothetical protein